MTMADTMNGPDWVLWVVTVLLLLMSIVLISGHGAGLIAGYNDITKEEKEKYNERKLCKVVGFRMAGITILLLVLDFFSSQIPAQFTNVMIGFVVADIVVMLVLCNTICKK